MERCLNQARVADLEQVPVIVFDFHRAGSQDHSLVLDRCRDPSYT
ncbi:MAG TPA: hypothetical protein VIX20_15050 [Ktedonobacteraceae bacterium]